MAITIQPPQPGDLITSNFMKRLIDQLVTLDARVAALEGVVPGAGGKLSILQIDPTDVPQGGELRIYGVNFGVPAENTVTFDSANPVTSFKAGSTDQLLILDVPSTMVLSSDAQTVTVAVSSARGFDSRQITIRKLQATLPAGTLTTGLVGATGAIVAGGSPVFQFSIDARSTLDEIYTLTPVLPTVTAGQTPWQATMVTDNTGATALPLLPGGPTPPPWQLAIPRPASGQVSTVVSVFMKVAIPGDSAVANPFVRLDVASSRNPMGFTGGSSGNNSITLGQPLPTNQTVTFGGFTATNGSVSGTTALFSVPTSPSSRVAFNNPSLKVGTYQISLSLQGNSNGWNALFAGGSPQIISFNQAVAGDHSNQQINVSATNPTGNATLVITVMTPAPATPHAPTQAELLASTAFGVYTLTLAKAT